MLSKDFKKLADILFIFIYFLYQILKKVNVISKSVSNRIGKNYERQMNNNGKCINIFG